MTIYERNNYIKELKKILPYPDEWYTKLKDAQVYVIYQKYSSGAVTVRPEQIKDTPKVYVKKANRVPEGQIRMEFD